MPSKSRNSPNPEKPRKRPKPSEADRKAIANRSERDAATELGICRRFLTILGVWYANDGRKFTWRLVVARFANVACYFGFGIRTIPTIVYIFLDTRDVNHLCNLVARVLWCFMSFAKYVLLQLHRGKITRCMKHIELDWMGAENSVTRSIMLDHSRYGLLVTKISATITYSAAIWQATLPYVIKKTPVAANENVTFVAPVRKFTVPSHFGFAQATQTPLYETIYTCQMVSTFMMHSTTVACYSIAVVSVMHACGQLKVLMEKINNLIDGDGEGDEGGNVDGRLADIVRHHVKTLRFIASAENMLQEMCFIDVGGSTIEICLLGYFNILEWKAEHKNVVAMVAYITLLATFTFNILSFCYIGELLTEECARVGEITYMIDWHRLPGKQPLALGLIITMTHTPVTLTAGKMFNLSLQGFCEIMKTAAAYLNVLRATLE